MRKLLKSRKALSPVVAAIILIAVTVAVSIAVAAWMGALTFTFMKTEELKITGITWAAGPPKYFNLTVTNTGANSLIYSSTTVDDLAQAGATMYVGGASTTVLAKGQTGVIKVPFTTWQSGYKYTAAVLTTSGNKYTYTTTAPP